MCWCVRMHADGVSSLSGGAPGCTCQEQGKRSPAQPQDMVSVLYTEPLSAKAADIERLQRRMRGLVRARAGGGGAAAAVAGPGAAGQGGGTPGEGGAAGAAGQHLLAGERELRRAGPAPGRRGAIPCSACPGSCTLHACNGTRHACTCQARIMSQENYRHQLPSAQAPRMRCMQQGHSPRGRQIPS